jgi:dTDP-4-amino-4,6-dideoxygalactose transaminase
LDELQAAFLREKLKVLDAWNTERKAIAKTYSKLLSSADCITPMVPEYADPVWHLYVIRSLQRDKLKAYLEQYGVSTVIHYPIPPHRQRCYAEYFSESFPIADLLAQDVMSLPMSPDMSGDQIEYVCQKIRDFKLVD